MKRLQPTTTLHRFVQAFAAWSRSFRRKFCLGFAVVLLLVALGRSFYVEKTPYPSISDRLDRLRSVRDRRKATIEAKFRACEKQARLLAADGEVATALQDLSQAFVRYGADSLEYQAIQGRYEQRFSTLAETHRYYDIFVINREGRVVYTVKKEDDFGANVAEGPFRNSAIGRCFATARRHVAFTSMSYYGPSGKPAQFVGAPVKDRAGAFLGCIALQLPWESIDEVVADWEGLGETGESYVVREDHLMLTSSRFVPNSALRQSVNTKAADHALGGTEGQDVLKDYRGVNVLSAFTHIRVGNVRWGIIVEMDVEEAFLNCPREEREGLLSNAVAEVNRHIDVNRVSAGIVSDAADAADIARFGNYSGFPCKYVETGSYARAEKKELLATTGVSTCTAVSVFGDGFAYLGHLSPTDAAYGHDVATRRALGSRCTDIVASILAEINARELHPVKGKAKLIVGIFAVRADTLPAIVSHVQKQGIDLSQIRVVYTEGPHCLNLVVDPAGAAYSQWRVAPDPQADKSERFYNIFGVIKSVETLIVQELRQVVATGLRS